MASDYLLIIKCCPEPWELSKVAMCVPCTEQGCARTFSSEANLRQHLKKFHKKVEQKNRNELIVRQFHCPVKECAYNEKNFFTTLKYLKQHYIKVHAEKKFGCEKCQKRFPTQYLQILHTQSCGNTFKCSECENQYSCYESLLTHARRKKHNIGNKELAHPWSVKKKPDSNDIARFKMISQGRLVAVAAHPAGQDKGVQTDAPAADAKPKTKRRATRETQTCSRKKTRKSAETQTSAAGSSRPLPITELQEEMTKICLETQREDELGAGTGAALVLQGCDPNLGGLDFLHSSLALAPALPNCNTETQTDFPSAETQTSPLDDLELYTNMYTQTYDEYLLPDGYESLATQSVLELDREMSNTQTQTEIEYLQLLEEINA